MTPERWQRACELFAEALGWEPGARRSLLRERWRMTPSCWTRSSSSWPGTRRRPATASSRPWACPSAQDRSDTDGEGPDELAPADPSGPSAATGSSGCWARAGSGGSTWPTTTTSTARWRSRCPTPSGSPAPRTSRRTWPRPASSPSLDHPHIVPVYDVGRTDDGLCYVVSKYIEGSDLAERMRQGRPSLPRSRRELVADGRRGAAPRPHAGPGPPGHQARQHPARRRGQAVRGRLRAGAAGTRTSARGRGSPGRPPT